MRVFHGLWKANNCVCILMFTFLKHFVHFFLSSRLPSFIWWIFDWNEWWESVEISFQINFFFFCMKCHRKKEIRIHSNLGPTLVKCHFHFMLNTIEFSWYVYKLTKENWLHQRIGGGGGGIAKRWNNGNYR